MQKVLWAILLLFVVATAIPADELELETDAVSKDYSGELPRVPPTEPEDTFGKFHIVDGFQIELAAHEPLISDPISMAFDERGRLFVVCMRGYSEHREDNLGVVRLLEDTDEDGVFDRGTDYFKGLAWPTAVACHDGGIFVGAAPNIFYCRDTNGDGVADEQKIVFTGFGHQNVQGMLNSFRWGLDNRLYGATGTNGGQVAKIGEPGEPLSLRGRDFSIDPWTLTMRPESGGAQHGATFDRWGERYVCSNSDHLQWIEREDRHLRRNPLLVSYGYRSRRSIATEGPSAEVYRTSEVEPWRVVRTRLRVKGLVGGPVEGGGRASGYFTSASGVTAYTGDAFPAPYCDGDYIFVGDVGSNLVHLKEISTQELARNAKRATADHTEFLTSTDNWFRPVQFGNGPDGALYVIDMYRETIEHPLSLPPTIKRHLDLNSGRLRGRIYRITPTGWRTQVRVMPSDADEAQLVTMLSHTNGWHRETAARLIVHRAKKTESDREKLAGLLRTACVEGTPDGRIRSLYCLQSIDRLTEGDLIRGLKDQHFQVRRHALKVTESAGNIGEATITQLRKMVTETDDRVRYQLALTWGRFDWDIRAEQLVKLASQTSELHYALISSMGEQRMAMLRMLLRDATSQHSVDLAVSIAHQIGRRGKSVGEAIRLLNTQPDDVRERLVSRLLAGTGLNGKRLIGYLSSQNVKEPADLLASLVTAAQPRALAANDPIVFRILAIYQLSLGEYQQVSAAFDELLSPQQPAEIRDAVVEQMGRYESIEVAESLVTRLNTLSPKGRRKAFELLTARTAWARLLLDHIADGTISSTQVATLHRQQLLNHRDSDVARLAKSTLGAESDRKAIVDQLTHVVDSTGDVARGKLAFRKVCSSCHRLEDHGADVGPQLQPLRNRGAAFMLVNILDPNREVDARYEAYTVLTDDGRTQSGILISDSASAVELLLADGTKAAFAKDEIEEFQATGKSLMPEGLERELTEQGIADVIAYLVQNVSPSKKDTTP